MQTAATTINANLETIKGAIAAKFDTATFTSWIAPLTFDIEKDTLVKVTAVEGVKLIVEPYER